MVDVSLLEERAPDLVLERLPVSRLNQGGGQYLVAWDGDDPVGHLHIALSNPPELQDVYVIEPARGRGISRTLIESAVAFCAERGSKCVRLEVSSMESELQAMYERLGFHDAGLPLRRVLGEVALRTGSIHVDDHLRMLERPIEE